MWCISNSSYIFAPSRVCVYISYGWIYQCGWNPMMALHRDIAQLFVWFAIYPMNANWFRESSLLSIMREKRASFSRFQTIARYVCLYYKIYTILEFFSYVVRDLFYPSEVLNASIKTTPLILLAINDAIQSGLIKGFSCPSPWKID